MKERPCAHCPNVIQEGDDFAIITFSRSNGEKNSKSKLYLCKECMTHLNKRVADGTLGEEDTWEMQDIDIENGILTKELIDWHIAYDAFFQCQAIKSYIGLVTGPHEKWGLSLEWMRRNTFKKKRHFNLKGLTPGSILKIRGIRNEEDIIRYIIVLGVEKHVLYYKTISEEQAVLAVSEPNQVEAS